MTPGINPASSACPIDTFAVAAALIIRILGGITDASMEPDKLIAVAYSFGYPFLCNALILILPIDAIAATEEPDIPAKSIFTTTDT